jgi:phytoene dehydrogenase-like protein
MALATIVGGGIAGLTAAITAAEDGCRVRLLEERSELGGRARTAPAPYRANLGPHALYADGPFWRWLEDRELLPETVGRGDARLGYRRAGRVADRLPGLDDALAALSHADAPHDVPFRDWARTLVGADAAELLVGFAFVPTFDADPGRLSAAFVQERVRRAIRPRVARYVVGGWATLVGRLADRATALGVVVETRRKVTTLPDRPVVVASAPAAARRLLGEPPAGRRPLRLALYDLALGDGVGLPSGVLDLDERLYLARYTAFDRTLAPPGEELVQIACACRPEERLPEVAARIERVLDSLSPAWRDAVRWSRRSLLSDATGAADLPGETWTDRPPVVHGDGVYRAGDYVGAPGLLSEVSFASGLEAGRAAAAFVRRRQRPASLLLVHGAGSGPWIFDAWLESFPGVRVSTVDLHEGLDVARASQDDYAARICAAARRLPEPIAVCGWSMGGLAAMQAVERIRPQSVILIEPSPPAEIQGRDARCRIVDGAFDPEAVYGPFPPGIRARPESLRARAERKRGISVPGLPCASLVVYGDEFREERGRQVARLYGSDELAFTGLDHWGLVLEPEVRTRIGAWLGLEQGAA